MCGIAGIIGQKADKHLLARLLSSIAHRGEPAYQCESVIFPEAAIGMNRLAIVDEYHGRQPFTNNRGVYCVFNGEIYNCDELKKDLVHHCSFVTNCDTEVVLQSYVHWGEAFVEKLDGKFAICILDRNKNQFVLARDHIGIKPLYYAETAGNLLFSSEKKSFCKLTEINTIKSLPPGSIKIGNLVKRYYSVPELSLKDKAEATLEGIKTKLENAIRKRIPKDSKRIACLLSGGLDSSIILYLARQFHSHVEAFTFASANSSSSDLEAASRLCKDLNINHIIVSPPDKELMDFYLQQGVYLTESYEPVLVRNAVSYHHVCKTVKASGYKFVLNGEGADELFGGYAFFKEIEPQHRDREIRQSLLELHKTYLQMADRASMFATIEARVPYMDKDFITYSMSFPSHFRMNGQQDKWALRQLFKDELPEYITQRAKTGMNEGAGFGRNASTESIYYQAVKRFYDNNPILWENDISTCLHYMPSFNINREDLEELYNFSRYIEYGFHRYEHAKQRLQLNTSLMKPL